MAPRAQWKGYLKIDEITCAVALYTAASTAERTRFHMINKKTGNRLKREFVDEKSGKPVDREDQVKGYETDNGRYIVLEQEEIDAVIPQGDKSLAIEAFIPCEGVDTVYFDKPYYIAPADDVAEQAFCQITLTDTERPKNAMERVRSRFPHTLVLGFEPEGGDQRSTETYGARIGRAADDLEICCGFVEHVRGRSIEDGERDMLRGALDRSREVEQSR